MSQLQHSLDILGFNDIDHVTAESLKKAFKVTVLKVHPDKGGNPEEFDHLLSAYIYVLETVHRIHGGRNSLSEIVSPEELKESRIDEVVNRIFEEFEQESFHAAFEKQNPRVDHGYSDWLQDKTEDTRVTEGVYGSATQLPPLFDDTVLQQEFEKNAKEGKPEPTALILHPEDMAYYSASVMGTAIIETTSGCYTSDPFMTPEYTDVYAAFTKENTLCDKVSPFVEHNKTLEELIEERNRDIMAPLPDKELEAIAAFEKKKLREEQEHLANVKNHYEHGVSGGVLSNELIYPQESYKGFVVEL